jgi:hypothetical protein
MQNEQSGICHFNEVQSPTLREGLNTLSAMNELIVCSASELAANYYREYLHINMAKSSFNPYSAAVRHLSEMRLTSVLNILENDHVAFSGLLGFDVVSGYIFNSRESRGGGHTFFFNPEQDESICLFPGYYFNDYHLKPNDSLELISLCAKNNYFSGYAGFLGSDQLPPEKRIFCLAGARGDIHDAFNLKYIVNDNDDPAVAIAQAFSGS